MRLANGAGIKLHQFYHRVGKFALIKHQRYQAIQARQQGLILAASFAKSRVAMSSNHRSDGYFLGPAARILRAWLVAKIIKKGRVS